MFRILIVEDDSKLRRLMCTVLERSGYHTWSAENGEQALAVMDREYVDLMICDIMMPGIDGYELTRSLRDAGYNLPILMVTAKDTFDDKKRGFSIGADDYMVKPIDINEMVLRVGALLRRAQSISERRLTLGELTLDCDSLIVTDGGQRHELPQKEFQLLYKLLSFPGKIFTRRQLMDEIWGLDSESDERTVDVHMSRLRDRFRHSQSFELVTVRGLGYKAVKKS